MILTAIIFFVLLSILVLVHEFGHFITARKFGVGAEEFGLGFPPRLFGWYRNTAGKGIFFWGNREVTDARDTVYSFNLIPIGGFVRIKGENGDVKDDQSSFATKSIAKRTLILSAGVIMNVILAAVIIITGLIAGLPQTLEGAQFPKGVTIEDRRIQILSVLPDSAAEIAELKSGDIINAIDGQHFANYKDLQNYVGDKAGKTLKYEIIRGKETSVKEIVPKTLEGTDRAGVGVSIAETGIVRYPWYKAIPEGIKLTGILLWTIIVGLATIIGRLFSGGSVSGDVVGPVGIAALTGQMADMGFAYLAQFAAILSQHLAVINFVPFPAMDGGRGLFLLIEKFKGSPVRQKTEAIIHNLGFILLIGLIIVVTFKDIIKLF